MHFTTLSAVLRCSLFNALHRYRYGYFSLTLTSFWSYASATVSLWMSESELDMLMGCVMILCILLEGALAMVVAFILYGPVTITNKLSAYLEPKSLMEYAYQHFCVSVLSFLEPRLLIFLPWRKSDFSSRSGGFPFVLLFKIILYIQCFVSTVRIIVLVLAHHSTTSTQASVYFSLISLCFSIGEGLIKLKSEKIQQFDTAIVSKARLGDVDLEIGMERQESTEDLKQTISSLNDEIEALRIANRVNSMRFQDEDNLHAAKTKYADENLEVIKAQVKELGGSPLEYIPLSEIEEELAQLTNEVNAGGVFDEKRLDHLLACMQNNPEYKANIAEKRKADMEKLVPILAEHLHTMREFIPPNIFDCTVKTLQGECGYSEAMAKRLFTKKCLWLVRMQQQDIRKLHEVELKNKYGHGGQGLDVVEKTALLAALPDNFENDGNGTKKKFVLDLEESVMQMLKKVEQNSLPKNLLRNPAYKDQVGIFGDNTEMYCPEVTSSEDAFSPRTSHKFKLRSDMSSFDESSTTEAECSRQDYSVSSHDPACKRGVEFVKRANSIDAFFRNKSPKTQNPSCRQEESSRVGEKEFMKRANSLDTLLFNKSPGKTSNHVQAGTCLSEREFVTRAKSIEDFFCKRSEVSGVSLAVVKTKQSFESEEVHI